MKILSIVFDDQLKAIVESSLAKDSLRPITGDEFFEEFENYVDGEYSALICEVRSMEFANEVGQVMRNQCPRTPIFACALDTSVFEPKVLIKNGFTEAFLFPVDRKTFIDQLAAAVSPEALASRVLKRVLIPDLQPGSKPNFTTYVHLPLNNKFLTFSQKDEEFSEKKVNKLKQHQVGTLFIDQKESNSFFEYIATQMKAGDNNLSATERADKLKESVRGMFHQVFDQKSEDSMESGRDLMASCRKIVSTYIMDGNGKADFHARLLRNMSGAGLDYNHSADVSTIAALFGMALGSELVESLAIAGFLHDLALAQFPEEYGYDVEPTWTDDLKKTFAAHPAQTVNLMKTKKMILPADAEKMILQHHERFDGKGFPRGLAGERIMKEAQILSLADQFHYLTISAPGKARLDPGQAMDKIAKNGSIAPEYIRALKEFLTPGKT